MALFGKKKSEPQASPAPGGAGSAHDEQHVFKGDERKAQKFFEHAATVAEARNYDYAIEMYTNGLRQDPDNMGKHEALFDVAKRRKVADGKPAGRLEKLKSSGHDPISKMIDAEKFWAMNFIDDSLCVEFMKRAVEADKAYDELNLGEVAFWIGSMALDFAATGKPKVKTYVTIRDLFSAIGRYDKAIEACRRAIRLDPKNHDLLHDLKNLDAENYASTSTAAGKAQANNEEEGNFSDNVRDKEHAHVSSTGVSGTASVVDQNIAKARTAYEENPEDTDLVMKLVEALVKKEDFDADSLAYDLLIAANEQTGLFKFKQRAGDIKMKQMNRDLRQLKQIVDAAPEAEEYKSRYEETLAKKLKFELAEYIARAKNYPTDMRWKYEVGKRMLQNGDVDDAIGMLQQGKTDPKVRSHGGLLLARAFFQKGWTDEALNTLSEAIEQHPLPDDAMGKEMRYEKMIALLESSEKNKDVEKAEEANAIASELLRLDINYKDIKDRKQQANDLIDKLKEA